MNHSEADARVRALERLRKHGALLAGAFSLPLRSIDAEGERVRRRYGICYADGSIRIRLHSVRAPEVLKYSALVDTLCHELAHLRHFDHGRRFWALYRRILAYARRHGIYKPGPEPIDRAMTPFPASIASAPPRVVRPGASRAPVQLELF